MTNAAHLFSCLFGTDWIKHLQHVYNMGKHLVNTTKNVTSAFWPTYSEDRPVLHSTYVILIICSQRCHIKIFAFVTLLVLGIKFEWRAIVQEAF